MKIRKTRMGCVIACEHEYTSNVTGKRKVIAICPARFVSQSMPNVVEKQAVAAGWEVVRFPGGKACFCPEHTRKAIAERERAKRQRNEERIWR